MPRVAASRYSALPAELVGDREHDEVVEHAPVRAPVPAALGRVRLSPRLAGLQRDQAVGGRDDARDHAIVPVERLAVQREVDRRRGGHAVRSRTRRGRTRRGQPSARACSRVGRVARGEPQLGRRPGASSSRSSSRVRAAAERALIVRRQQHRLGVRGPVGGHGRGEQPARVRRVVGEHARAVRRGRREVQRRRGRRPVQDARRRVLVRPARAAAPTPCRAPGGTPCPACGGAGGHLHPQQPVELPAALLEQQRLGPRPPGRRASRRRRISSTVASSCHTGIAPLVTYLPWSPASYQPPETSKRPGHDQPGYSRSASGPGPGRDARVRRDGPAGRP